MSHVIFDISMSLDGFITGANRTPEKPLGDEGEHLHDWAFNSKDEYNRNLISQSVSTLGAVICGFVSSSRQRRCRMDQQEDFAEMAKEIIDSTLYMVLGTADESGQPWVSPVYFTALKYKEFYWISSPGTRHSRNIAKRSQVSIVIFNSQAHVGKAQAVCMSAAAEELAGSDLERGLVIYNRRFPDPVTYGVQDIRLEEVRPPGFYRLYRAMAMEHWVLDPYASPDRRTLVTVLA